MNAIAQSGGESKAIAIGREWQLFLDDAVLARCDNAARRLNPAAKEPHPVLRPDRPWEGGAVCIFGSVLLDPRDRLFKMWYYTAGHVGYAVSRDGLAWEKPELDVVRGTNLVMERGAEIERGAAGRFGYFYENMNVILDEGDPDPGRRFKMCFVAIQFQYSGPHEAAWHKGSRRGLGTAVSADGIHWRVENEFASYEVCDISHCMRDEALGRYVLYGRTKLTPENQSGRWRACGWGRAVSRIESPDFRAWSEGKLVMAADTHDPDGTEIYSMSVFPHEGIYIGLVQMFFGLPTQYNLHVQLAASRDGHDFTRVEQGKPFIPEGEIGAWDRFNISVASQPLGMGDELWFYYSGRTCRHSPYKGKDDGPPSSSIGLAKIKRGRFLALEASFDGGAVETKPLVFRGGALALNANAAYGSIRVSLIGADGNILPGGQAEVSGRDSLNIPVAFGSELSGQARHPVRVRFEIRNAQLYAFRLA